jgi:AraC-like DNA-binding protein
MRPTVHGLFGFAAMSAATMREAIAMVIRYAGARQAHFELRLEESNRACQLVLHERFPIPVLRTFFYENILLGLGRGTAVLLGWKLDDFRECEIAFDTSEPPYYSAWRSRLPRVSFDQRVNALRFPRKMLDMRPALSDPHARKQAVDICERELTLATGKGFDLAGRVLGELARCGDGGYPSVGDVASRLFLSTRTLKRHLQDEGTTFRSLLSEARKRHADELLTRTDLPVEEIADRLGYENPANFSRAFRRAVGKTPTQYRAQARARTSSRSRCR